MSLTPSTMLPLGTLAPDFSLPDVITQKPLKLSELQHTQNPAGIVIVFMCNHCPYVRHILPKLLDMARLYQQKDIIFVGINANDIKNYPDDAPEKMAELAKRMNFPFAYLFDESQEIARAYQAACTPDFYLFDSKLHCVYRGRFDEATPGNQKTVTGEDLRTAMDNLLAGKDISSEQFPSMGCNIKYRQQA